MYGLQIDNAIFISLMNFDLFFHHCEYYRNRIKIMKIKKKTHPIVIVLFEILVPFDTFIKIYNFMTSFFAANNFPSYSFPSVRNGDMLLSMSSRINFPFSFFDLHFSSKKIFISISDIRNVFCRVK